MPITDPPSPPVWPYLFSTAVVYGRESYVVNLRMTRGDEFIFNIAVVLDGVAVNITGKTLRMTAKWSADDADADAVFSLTSTGSAGITVTNAAGGLATVTVAPAKTSSLPARQVSLVYDIQLHTDATDPKTIASGTLLVRPDVTRTVV
jgi:phage terminase large subunit-like protein